MPGDGTSNEPGIHLGMQRPSLGDAPIIAHVLHSDPESARDDNDEPYAVYSPPVPALMPPRMADPVAGGGLYIVA